MLNENLLQIDTFPERLRTYLLTLLSSHENLPRSSMGESFQEKLGSYRALFAPLMNVVKDRYEDSECDCKLTPFLNHVEEVSQTTLLFGLVSGGNEYELRVAYVAARLHDLTKLDSPPDQIADTPLAITHVLLNHPNSAADEAEGILARQAEDNPNYWNAIFENTLIMYEAIGGKGINGSGGRQRYFSRGSSLKNWRIASILLCIGCVLSVIMDTISFTFGSSTISIFSSFNRSKTALQLPTASTKDS